MTDRITHERDVAGSSALGAAGLVLDDRKKAFADAARVSVILLVALITLLIRLPYCTDDILTNEDDADYFRSVQPGLVSIYLEQNSLSFFAFARLVRDRDPAARAHPWDRMYRLGDASALRHFHVPLSFYAGAVAARFHVPSGVYRAMSAAVGATACGLIVFYLTGTGVALPLAACFGLLIAALWQFVATNTEVNPHTWFLLFAVAFLFSLARYFRDGDAWSLRRSSCLLACCFATLELAPILLLTAIVAAALHWRSLNPTRLFRGRPLRNVAEGAAIFCGTLFLLWPGGVLKGGYLKSYGVFVWQALFRRQEYFGPLTRDVFWLNLFAGSWVLAILCAWAIIGGIRLVIGKKAPPAVLVFVIYSCLAVGINIGNRFWHYLYAAEVLIPLLITSAMVTHWTFGEIQRVPLRRALVSGMAGLCVFGAWQDMGTVTDKSQRSTHVASLEGLIQAIPRIAPPRAIFLVNRHRGVYSLYLPDYAFEETEEHASIVPLSLQHADRAEYLLLDPQGITPDTMVQIDQKYDRQATFGSATKRNEILLFHVKPDNLLSKEVVE